MQRMFGTRKVVIQEKAFTFKHKTLFDKPLDFVASIYEPIGADHQLFKILIHHNNIIGIMVFIFS